MEQFCYIFSKKMDNLGLSGAELHRLSGVPSTRISKYRKGIYLPSQANFDKLNAVLHFTDAEIQFYQSCKKIKK